MKKLIALVVAAFALAGCSNFVADFGIPSVRFGSTGYGSTTNGDYEVRYEIQPQRGSPSGQILHIITNQASILGPGVTVPECPPSTPSDDCPKIPQKLSFSSNPGSLAITGYAAKSLNGTTRTITLPGPVIINP